MVDEKSNNDFNEIMLIGYLSSDVRLILYNNKDNNFYITIDNSGEKAIPIGTSNIMNNDNVMMILLQLVDYNNFKQNVDNKPDKEKHISHNMEVMDIIDPYYKYE